MRSPPQLTPNRQRVKLDGLVDAEHLGPAGGTDAFGGGSAVLHDDGLGFHHFALFLAFHTSAHALIPPYLCTNINAIQLCEFRVKPNLMPRVAWRGPLF